MTNHEGHIKLWDELARTGSRDKEDTFERLFPEIGFCEASDTCCFACQELYDRYGEERDCKDCPIVWGNSSDMKSNKICIREEYGKWIFTDDPDDRKRLAAIIRDLPWREKK